ncbi:uncharacterized protein [Temnothorax longispinosus]|uniref:uncharacterized protein n=1 Tax=Temnothorax longispinosus TaxID=300112 RepID=UPI003A9917F5
MQFETGILQIHQAKCRNINEHSESDGGTGHYNVDATIQQPVTTENDASTSFHNDRHERVSENQEDQQRYAVIATIQQPVTAENYASTSFHNDRHGRGSENQEDQQSSNHSGQQGSRMSHQIWMPNRM